MILNKNKKVWLRDFISINLLVLFLTMSTTGLIIIFSEWSTPFTEVSRELHQFVASYFIFIVLLHILFNMKRYLNLFSQKKGILLIFILNIVLIGFIIFLKLAY